MEKDKKKVLCNIPVTPITTAKKVGDAVGVKKRCWFVAIVNNNAERQCAQKLEKLGFECYVPIQTEMRIWRTGVKKMVERIILPSMILIHATEQERKQKVVVLPYIYRFMPNRAGKSDSFGKHPVAIIPDNQIQRLKFILGKADAPVEFDQMHFRLGDRVRIIRGGLTGAEGHIIECGDNTYFAIQVDFLGVAKIRIKKEDIEIITKQ